MAFTFYVLRKPPILNIFTYVLFYYFNNFITPGFQKTEIFDQNSKARNNLRSILIYVYV